MQAFVARDEFVGCRESRHESVLLQSKMAANDPEKKIPSTAAKVMSRLAKDLLDEIHRRAQSAFSRMHGMASIAVSSLIFSSASFMYVSMKSEYISEWIFSIVKHRALGSERRT